tara:strand:- start:1615 stop:2007 length:393 start_codon:yes stop_codon:yes gene_type:complete
MRYNRPRRKRFRNNDQEFRKNGSHDLRGGGINSVTNNFQRKSFHRNGAKAEKLLEKYNTLAKEALSNGDIILSESYFQYADHFLRVIESKNSKNVNSKPQMENSSGSQDSEEKIVLENKEDSSHQKTQDS